MRVWGWVLALSCCLEGQQDSANTHPHTQEAYGRACGSLPIGCWP